MSALGHKRTWRRREFVMSALTQKADNSSVRLACPLWTNSGHNDMSGGAATAGECAVSLSACFLWDRQRSTGSDYKSHDCLPPHSVGIRPTSDTGSPNGHRLCLPHTREPRRPLSAVDRRAQQEQRQRRKSRGPSSTSVVGAGNNAKRYPWCFRLRVAGVVSGPV